MAYINPQAQIDQQQNERNDRNMAAIGSGLTNFANAFQENRRRAVDQARADKQQGKQDELYALQKTKAQHDADQLKLPYDQRDDYKTAAGIAALKRASSSPKENLTYQQKLDMKAQKDAEVDAQKRQDPTYKLEKLGAEGRSKVGAIASGIQALDQMHVSGVDGYGPQRLDSNTPLVGGLVSDTPYTEGERTVAEVIGRLQSGGAMNDTEIKTFKALGPRPGDDAESKKRKLEQQKDFLANKLTAFGLKHNDLGTLGFETKSKYVPAKFQGQDAEAFQWARQNSDNPKAQEIMKRLGVN